MTAFVALHELGLVWLGAFLGSFVAGASGFGFALAASAIWLHELTPVQTTLMVVTCGAILQTGMVWSLRRSIVASRIWPFVLGCVFGIPIGVRMLATWDSSILKHIIGGMLVIFGGYGALARKLPVFNRGGRTADAMVGFAGGVLGGVGFSGVLPMIWTQLRGWSSKEARAIYQPYIIIAQVVTLLMIGTFGLDRSGLWLTAMSLPPLVAGCWMGWKLYGRFDDATFRRVVACGVFLSGLTLVI